MKNPENKYNEEVINIIEKFNPKIKRSLHNTTYQEREDLEQEIKIKIIEKLSVVKFKKAPGFWELLKYLSVHSFPEHAYASIDIYTCGRHVQPELVIQYLYSSLEAKYNNCREIVRGIKPENL